MELRWSYNICSFTKDVLLYFSRFLLRFVLQLYVKKFSKFYELLFPKDLLVAAANRLKVLKTFISLKVTVYIQDRRLRSEKALDVQGFEWKYICIYIQQNLVKQFTLHSVEAYSEHFPTSKQGGYLIGGNYFHKKLHLRCLKRF